MHGTVAGGIANTNLQPSNIYDNTEVYKNIVEDSPHLIVPSRPTQLLLAFKITT